MAKNIQGVLFLRNGSLYANHAAALTGIEEKKSLIGDGQLILARYSSGDDVKTLVGVKYSSGGTNSLTIFDVEGASADVEKLREEIDAKLGDGITSSNTATAQLAALSGATFTPGTSSSADTSVEGAKAYAFDLVGTLDVGDTAVTGSYVSKVSQADGKISVQRVALPDASSVADENKIVTDVTQSKGKITATASNITGVKLAGYAEGTDADIAATDTLGEALGKLQAQINAMDKSADVVDGQVVTTVTEVDGKVTETKANVKDLQLGGYAKDTSATGNIASTDTINVALSKLENKAAAITITNADGSINVTTASTGTDINVNIKTGEHVIAKDGNNGLYTNISLSSITPSSTTVKEEYQLTATDGTKLGETIKIYKDSALVNFFLGHVDDLLSGTTAQTEESESSTVVPGAGDTALVYVMQLANGNYKLTAVDVEAFIEEAEFASGVTWDNEAHKVKGVVDPDSELDEANVPFLTVDADGFKISGIKDAIDTKINKLDADLSGNSTHVTVGVAEADGKITAVTVSESNVANADDLTNEIAARKAVDGQNGQTYAANTSSPYISGATSLNDADVKLASALKSLSDETVNQVKVNNVALAETNNAVNVQISSVAASGTDASPIEVNTDGNGAITLGIAYIDCGEY